LSKSAEVMLAATISVDSDSTGSLCT
jgi:hypothetical protein